MEEKIIRKEKIEEILENLYLMVFAAYIAFFFLGTTMFQITWPEHFYTDLYTALTGFILVRLAYSKRCKIQDIVFILGLYVLFEMAFKRNGYEEYIYLLVLMIGAKDISFRKIIKVYTAMILVLLLGTVICSLTGHVENLSYIQEGRRTRYAFGINYPTDFSAHIFYLILCWGFLRGKRITYIELGVFGLLGGVVYWFCDARLNTICILGSAVTFAVHKCLENSAEKKGKSYHMHRGISALLMGSGTICAAVMIWLTMLYSPDNAVISFLDRALSSRLRLGKKGIDIFGFTLWGQDIPMIGLGSTTEDVDYYFFLDSSYLYILLQFGLLMLIVLLFVWLCIGIKSYRNHQWVLLWIIALVAVQCMVEHHMVSIAYNPFWLALLADLSIKGTTRKSRRLEDENTMERL